MQWFKINELEKQTVEVANTGVVWDFGLTV